MIIIFNWIKLYSLIKCEYKNAKNGIHTHSYYQLTFVLEGEGGVRFPDGEQKIKKGDVLFFKPSEQHGLFSENMLTMEFKFNLFYSEYKEKLDFPFKIIKDSNNEVRKLTTNIENHVDSEGPYYEDFIKLEFAKILLTYLKFANTLTTTENKRNYINRKKSNAFCNAIDYILDNLDKKISLKDLADIERMEATYFNKKFKTIYGVTPMQYINITRLTKAKDYLKNTNLNISETSVKVGFSSLHYFSRWFTKHQGISPKEYKNSVKKAYIINIDFP